MGEGARGGRLGDERPGGRPRWRPRGAAGQLGGRRPFWTVEAERRKFKVAMGASGLGSFFCAHGGSVAVDDREARRHAAPRSATQTQTGISPRSSPGSRCALDYLILRLLCLPTRHPIALVELAIARELANTGCDLLRELSASADRCSLTCQSCGGRPSGGSRLPHPPAQAASPHKTKKLPLPSRIGLRDRARRCGGSEESGAALRCANCVCVWSAASTGRFALAIR